MSSVPKTQRPHPKMMQSLAVEKRINHDEEKKTVLLEGAKQGCLNLQVMDGCL